MERYSRTCSHKSNNYALINKRFQNSALGVKTHPGTSRSSNSDSVLINVRISLKTIKKKNIKMDRNKYPHASIDIQKQSETMQQVGKMLKIVVM